MRRSVGWIMTACVVIAISQSLPGSGRVSRDLQVPGRACGEACRPTTGASPSPLPIGGNAVASWPRALPIRWAFLRANR